MRNQPYDHGYQQHVRTCDSCQSGLACERGDELQARADRKAADIMKKAQSIARREVIGYVEPDNSSVG